MAIYEVQLRYGKNWENVSSHNEKTAARTSAQELLKNGKSDAVRVLENEGGESKQVFFTEKPRVKLNLTIGEIVEAPPCVAAADFRSGAARRTIVVLFRDFLASRGITAFELVHHAGHIKDLESEKDLFAKAIQRVATLQARAAKTNLKARMAEIKNLATELASTAGAASGLAPIQARIKSEGIGAARAALANKANAATLGAALAGVLAEGAGWEAKLSLLIELLERDASKESLALIDSIVAELVEVLASLGVLLGLQSDPGGALIALSELARGAYKAKPDQDKGPAIDALNRALAKYRLPLTQAAIVGPVAAALRGTKPLTKIGGNEDYKAFFAVIAAARSGGGLVGGGMMAEAVIRRMRVVMGSPGRDLSVDEALATTLDNLKSRAERIGFLLDVSPTEIGGKCRPATTRLLNVQANGLTSIRDLVEAGAPSTALAFAFEDVFTRLADEAVPAELKGIVLKALARVSATVSRRSAPAG